MADQRIDIDIKINSKTGEISLKSLDKSFDTLKIKAGQAQQAAKALNLEISQITSAGNVNVAANNFGTLQKQIGGASAASGSASSSVLELGRVISDSNYGIRGMANNFSQLASNLLFTAKAAGGFGAALGQVGKALMGPLGFLLLIQAGIALLERFSMQSKKAEEAVKGLGDEIAKETSELEILKRSMENENVTQSQRIELVNDANEKYTDLNISLGENGKLTDESVEAIDRKIFALTRLAKANAIQLEIEKEMSKELSSELKKEKLIEDAGFADIEAFEKFQKMYLMALDDRNTLMSDAMLTRQFGEEATYSTGEAGLAIFKIIEAIKDASDVSVEAQKQIDRLIKKASEGNQEIRDIINGEGKGSSTLKRIFKQQSLDLSKQIDSFNKRQEQALVKSETKLNEIKRHYEKEELKRKYDSFIEKEKLRLKNYIAITKDEELIAQAKKLSDDTERAAEIEYGEALTDLKSAQNEESLRNIRDFNKKKEDLARENKKILEDIEFAEESQERINKGFITGERGEATLAAEGMSEEGIRLQTESNLKIQLIEDELASKTHSLEMEAELEVQREEMRGKSLEGAKMISKAKITLDKLELESKKQALSDLGSLLNSASQIANRNSVEGKALAVASTTISTYASAQDAYESQIIPGDPTSLPRAVLAAAASVASGLARVKQILAVKVPGGTGGSAPSGGESREFDFNLVGSTGVNQLAEGIGGQFDQPIQAYVVSSQMTSQQQLDNVIQSSATIGD